VGTKKKVKPAATCHDLTCVREGIIPVVLNCGNEENEKKKKTKNKKWVILKNKSDRSQI